MSGYSRWTNRRKRVKKVEELIQQIRSQDVDTNVTHNNLDFDIQSSIVDIGVSSSALNLVTSSEDEQDTQNVVLTDETENILELSNDSNDREVTAMEISRQALVEWSAHHNIGHLALKDLLHILKPHFPNLPSDPRTLRNTPRQLNVIQISGGSFVYFGIEQNIVRRLQDLSSISNWNCSMLATIKTKCKNPILTLSIGIDGIPLSRSSKHEFWPILGKVDQINLSVFVIGLFYGNCKPQNLDFLDTFIDDMVAIEKNGLLINNILFDIRVSCFIADTPARNLLKNVKSFNGYYGCDKCNQSGTWIGRVVYLETDISKRTDEDFNNQTDAKHHTGTCSLTKLDVGLVTQMPLDYMHLVCLGVVRKLLRLWTKGSNCPHKLSQNIINRISANFLSFKAYLPKHFQRRPRVLAEIDNFKATEFRTIMLYTFYPAFLTIIPLRYFKHFLLLHCAMFILLSKKADDKEWNHFAHSLLVRFIEQGKQIYGLEFCVFNVHGLLHLCDDALNFGALDNVSAFPFESFMQKIKKMKRSNNNYLTQVSNRILEMERLEIVNSPTPVMMTFSEKNSDNCLALKSGEIVIVYKILQNNNNEYCVLCRKFNVKRNLEHYPFESSKIGIFMVGNESQEIRLKFSLSDILCKCILFPCNEMYVCIPLMHSIN